MFGLGKSRKNDIKASDAHELIKNLSELEFVILDVRSPGEYSEEHIDRAENIDYIQKSLNLRLIKGIETKNI